MPSLIAETENPRARIGGNNPPSPIELEPAFVSIAATAIYTGESQWTVKDKLRRGIYRAKKSGARTLVIFATVKEHVASLPDATFAPVRDATPRSETRVQKPAAKPRRTYRRRQAK